MASKGENEVSLLILTESSSHISGSIKIKINISKFFFENLTIGNLRQAGIMGQLDEEVNLLILNDK